VASQSSNLYARWRAQNGPRLLLGEHDRPHPPERLLQNIWLHQRLRRDQLLTADGRTVQVLHPGFWNKEAGPDFRGAVLQFGHDPAQSGDVEIDLVPGNWHAHGHAQNPAYANVLLHVVWETPSAALPKTPVLALKTFIDSPVTEIQQWADGGTAADWPDTLRGACSAPLAELPEGRAHEILLQAAQVRFERKAREIELRARQAGWEQALWEGIFRALGYKHNTWPMQRLGELLPRINTGSTSVLAWQARLLGVGGLLPSDIPKPGADPYLRELWDHWWRERDELADVVLPRNLWRFNGLRPANQPQRRLALAAHWLSNKEFLPALERWFTTVKPASSPADSLLICLQPAEDSYWSWRWVLGKSRLRRPQPLLGAARVTDLAVNVILPWFWTRARAGRREELWKLAESRYRAWPAAQDNALLRLARRRLLGGTRSVKTNTAATQQGLLQIVRDFCDHSNAICADCRFPELVRSSV
jgi:hypothetical protein